MKIAFFINTPAQAHMYKNITRKLKENGHEIKILARGYRETIDVLNGLDINYFLYMKAPKSKYVKSLIFPSNVFAAYMYLNSFKPDLLIGHAFYSVYTSQLLRRPSIIFNDCDNAPVQFILVKPFVSAIITPKNFQLNLGEKQIRVDSYKEIAYLRPADFKPNKNIFNLLDISPEEKFVLIRFNAFDAAHDRGIKGFSLKEKRKLISELEKYVKVFISSEGILPNDIKQYSLRIPKHRIHDVLYYANMVIADTATIITESAILGTPAVVFHPKVKMIGNFIELGKENNLIFMYNNANKAIEKIIELVQKPNLKEEWQEKRERLLKDKIDFTKFMVWFIENYPQSFKEIKENPEIQYRFRLEM